MNETDKRAIEEIPADAVIQALKCCASAEDNCCHCPFKMKGAGIISGGCITAMSRAALDLIYRKQSEGEWEIVKGSNGKEKMVCTNCRHQQDLASTFTYCPNCGAKMKGGAE